MATRAEFRKQFKEYVDHPGYSNIDFRAHFDCPNCKANLLLLWHFYPEQFLRYCKKGKANQGNGGFDFQGVEYYRLPSGEVIQDYTCKSSDGVDGLKNKKGKSEENRR